MYMMYTIMATWFFARAPHILYRARQDSCILRSYYHHHGNWQLDSIKQASKVQRSTPCQSKWSQPLQCLNKHTKLWGTDVPSGLLPSELDNPAAPATKSLHGMCKSPSGIPQTIRTRLDHTTDNICSPTLQALQWPATECSAEHTGKRTHQCIMPWLTSFH